MRYLYQKLLLVITSQYYATLWLWSIACLELARIHYSADTRLWDAKWGVE